MAPKLSRFIAAGFGALSLLAGAAVYAQDVPLSVNESGPVPGNHEVAPSNQSPATGRSGTAAVTRDVRGPYTYEVQTPSSVSESAPWLTGQTGRR
jgi:hypothetical protein